MSLPKKRSKWQVPSYKIEDILVKEGYTVESPKTSIITFERPVEARYPELESHLEKSYRKKYPTIAVHAVTIRPTTTKYRKFLYSSRCDIRLSKSALRKNSGTFVVACGKKRFFFKYTIEADIGVYKANHQIKKDKMIDSNSVRFVTIPFERLSGLPVTDPGRDRYMARQNIAAGKIITRKMVMPVPAVRKHERVLCIYNDGPVHIEFEATAMQNGYVGDNITVKKSDGKSIRGVVLGGKTVEIR